MKTTKVITPIVEGINRRFFVAMEAIVSLGRVSSLESFCKLYGLSPSRYREIRLTYGITPNPNSKPSRYKQIELEALHSLCINYSISTEWLLLGRGKMFKNETNRKI
ncbi:MAG: hypothetical protein LBQ22_05460 [Bacteroidales bacterium]|jgi:hypothetical protein|nr:hypothetical protein [Bacteroidales bacterium]